MGERRHEDTINDPNYKKWHLNACINNNKGGGCAERAGGIVGRGNNPIIHRINQCSFNFTKLCCTNMLLAAASLLWQKALSGMVSISFSLLYFRLPSIEKKKTTLNQMYRPAALSQPRRKTRNRSYEARTTG
jgi:hypothetical protein